MSNSNVVRFLAQAVVPELLLTLPMSRLMDVAQGLMAGRDCIPPEIKAKAEASASEVLNALKAELKAELRAELEAEIEERVGVAHDGLKTDLVNALR